MDVTVFFGQQYLKHHEVYFLKICLPTLENIYRPERKIQHFFRRFIITALKESMIGENIWYQHLSFHFLFISLKIQRRGWEEQ